MGTRFMEHKVKQVQALVSLESPGVVLGELDFIHGWLGSLIKNIRMVRT
jgi:hypothetical protein